MSISELSRYTKADDILLRSTVRLPKPFESFDCTHFPHRIISSLNQSYKAPTPIQSFSWPVLMSGHDLIGIAETGSGKTISYILPSVVHI